MNGTRVRNRVSHDGPMHAPLCLLRFGVGILLGWPAVFAQTDSRPAIFAPQREGHAPAASPKLLLSERVRALVATASERVLAEAKAFDAPSNGLAERGEPLVIPVGDTVRMPQYLVKARPLRREAVEPPEIPLLQFRPTDREDRGLIGGVSTRLLRLFDGKGEMNLNILQMAGRGNDHGRDFTRVELEFRFRW